MRKILLIASALCLIAGIGYATDYAKRFPTDTALEVVTPTSGNATYLRLDSSNDPVTGGLLITGGNVGIGYTAPVALLHVGTAPSSGLFVFRSGNVGIGTTNPLYALHVNGDLYCINFTSETVTDIASLNDIGTNGNIGAGTTAPIYRLDVRGSGDVIFNNTGNVGIGTTNPTQKLAVSGSVTATSYYGDGSTLSNVGGTTISGGTDNYLARFNTDGDNVENSNIYDNGNVGIGTSSPGARLDIQDATAELNLKSTGTNANALIYTDSTGTGDSFLRFRNDSVREWDIQSDSSADDLLFFRQTTGEVMRLTDGGNVGIGTTAPVEKLDVAGNIGLHVSGATSGSNLIKLTRDAGNISGGAILLKGDTATTDRYLQLGKTDNTGTFTAQVSVLDNGNVGIGTTNPLDTLSVAKDITGATIFGNATNTSHLSLTGVSDPTMQLVLGYNSARDRGFIQSVNWGNGYRDLLLNASGGDVGIGTTDPAYALEVKGDLHAGTGVNQGLFVTSTGNVGIGQTTPRMQLEIQGAIAVGTLGIGDTPPSGVLYIFNDGTDLKVRNSSGTVVNLTNF